MSGKPVINVKPLQDYYLYLINKRNRTASEVAEWLGWYRTWGKSRQPDTDRVLRRLGLKATLNGHSGIMRKQTVISEDKALEIAEALGLDPVDIGL